MRRIDIHQVARGRSFLSMISKAEAKDLLLAWLGLSLAFAIVQGGMVLTNPPTLVLTLVVSLSTVGLGFLLHELMHKFAAMRYGRYARFYADRKMIIGALLMSLFGFVFAAPGAVVIHGHLTKKESAIVSAAGPATNILLSLLFWPLIAAGGFLGLIAAYGFRINAFLAVFNMIPVWQLDGAKILPYSKVMFGVLIGMPAIMLFI
ncbi:MAG: hypothetical protein ABIC95_01685 [archaeon]